MDWWQDLLRYLVKEGATIKRAPLVFVSMLVLGAVGGWTGGTAWRGQEVANLNALAEGHKAEAARLRTEIDAFKSLQDRMQAIDDSFTDQQLKELERQLGIVAPGSEVELVEPRKESTAWDQIFTALRDSGWKVGTTNQLRSWADPSTLAIVTTQAFAEPTVVLSTSNSSESQALRTAFEAAGIRFIERQIAEGESQTPQIWVLSTPSEAGAWLTDALPERDQPEAPNSSDHPAFAPALPSNSEEPPSSTSDETLLPMNREPPA